MSSTPSVRDTILTRLQRRLERNANPRLQMGLLVALTAGAGFLCSVTLLTYGMREMWLRYLLSLGVAYLVFLLLLWSWMRISGPSYVDSRDLVRLDSPEPVELVPIDLREYRVDGWRTLLREAPDVLVVLAVPLALLAFCAMLLWMSFYVVSAAPLLFAELLLDGVLAVTLYQRLRSIDVRYWLATAVRRTYIPFLAAAILLVLAGIFMGWYLPEAQSAGEVLRHALG